MITFNGSVPRRTLNFMMHDPPLPEEVADSTASHCDKWLAELVAGPANMAVMIAAFELNLITELRKRSMTYSDIKTCTGISDDSNVLHFLNSCISIALISLGNSECSTYSLAFPMTDKYFEKLSMIVKFEKWIVYRQIFYFTEALLAAQPVGVKKLFGEHHKNLYTACEEEPTLYDHWTPGMDLVTDQIEETMLSVMDYKQGSRILDCAGQTGLGAVKLLKVHPGKDLHVTVLDQHWKEKACRERFVSEGLTNSTDFVAGDVLVSIPSGFDVVQFKHFINMFNADEIRLMFQLSYDALPSNGLLMTFTLHAPEDLVSDLYVPFCTTYFIASARGRGGPWQASYIANIMFAVGFIKVEILDVWSPHTVLMGYKS